MSDAWNPPADSTHWKALDYVLTGTVELLADSDVHTVDSGLIEVGAAVGCQMYDLDDERAIAWVSERALRELAATVVTSTMCPSGARAVLVDLAGETLTRSQQIEIASAAAERARTSPRRPGQPRRSPARSRAAVPVKED